MFIVWRRSPNRGRSPGLPLRNFPTTCAPLLNWRWLTKKASGQLREFMRASQPSLRIKNQFADQLYKLAINASARESHYSDRRFFCNTFFKTFVLRNEVEIFANSQCLHSMFLTSQTSLLSEDTWSLKTLLDVVLSIQRDDRWSKWDLKILKKTVDWSSSKKLFAVC